MAAQMKYICTSSKRLRGPWLARRERHLKAPPKHAAVTPSAVISRVQSWTSNGVLLKA